MFSIFTLHRSDVLPTGDLGVRKGMQVCVCVKACQGGSCKPACRICCIWGLVSSCVSLVGSLSLRVWLGWTGTFRAQGSADSRTHDAARKAMATIPLSRHLVKSLPGLCARGRWRGERAASEEERSSKRGREGCLCLTCVCVCVLVCASGRL
jgi:hypothetical protein